MSPEKLKAHLAKLANGFATLVGYNAAPVTAPAVLPANVMAARFAAAQDIPYGAPAYNAGPLAVAVPTPVSTTGNVVTAQRPAILETQLDDLQRKMAERAANSSPALNVLQRRQFAASVGGK